MDKGTTTTSSSSSLSTKKVVVVGATGATGKHVVQMLLDHGGYTVVAVARSKEKMVSLLVPSVDADCYGDRLVIKEASIVDLDTNELKDLTNGCFAIVSCLGHNLTFHGMYRDGRFVTALTKALTTAMPKDCKYILMGSNGVQHPDGTTDPKMPWSTWSLLALIRWVAPPHSDNELAALYLHQHMSDIPQWAVVRPPDLVLGEVSDYDIVESRPTWKLFGDGEATRANVAHFMVRLIVERETWSKYNHKMPIIYNKSLPTLEK